MLILYVTLKNNIQFTICDDLKIMNEDCKNLWIEIKNVRQTKCIIGVIHIDTHQKALLVTSINYLKNNKSH